MTRIRKATTEDLPAIVAIYDEVHSREEAGEVTIGWIRDVYPIQKTAEDSIKRGDMFVQETDDGEIVGTAIINQMQVDVYDQGDWERQARDEEVMVIHTLIISASAKGCNLGAEFIEFYENYAREQSCTSLRLDTNARNEAARAFYKNHGYKEIGIVPTVFNDIPGVDLVLIEKKI